ncbi:MAG: cytochrome P450, partial [Pseudonocardia sp.]|nr:cytochrome P450 [Pseudonocardia sp.]
MPTPNTCPVTGDAPEDATGPLTFPFEHPTALAPPLEWAQLRERCPVTAVHTVAGEDALLLTRYDDVRSLLADPRFTRTPID